MGLKSIFKPKPEGTLMRKDIDMELFKFFKVIKVLGRGSYSTVYKVERLSDGRFYALKQTDVSTLNARERKAMVNEVRLLASLRHPNLMEYFEAFCDKHHLCIVTDLATCDLGSLIDKRAAAGDLLPERQVWSFLIQMALALECLHLHHVLHRDLKPQNVLVSSSGLMKIADLGISQVLDHVFTRVMVGTPYYMSPEMWRRDPYSYSADVWALGCILYELCALKPLFMAHDEQAIKKKILSGMLEPLPSRYSLDLWDVMRLMLTPDPALRPTIFEVLQMPAMRAHMHLVPEEEQPALTQTHQDPVQLLQPIQVPRMSADWEHINVFLPPAKYSSGPSVVEALRMKASNSCPDLTNPGEGAGDPCPGVEGAGGGALFGPTTGRGRITFGQVTAAPSEYFSVTRHSTEPSGAGQPLCKMPSTGSLRLLERSHSVAVGEVVFHSHKGQGSPPGSPGTSVQRMPASRKAHSAAYPQGNRKAQCGEGSSEARPAQQRGSLDSREVARAGAEAWERARNWGGSGGGGAARRHSVSVAQVLLNHTAADDFVATHDRHEQHLEQMQHKADSFRPAPVVFCPPPPPPTARKQPAPASALAPAASAAVAAAAGSAAAAAAEPSAPKLAGEGPSPAKKVSKSAKAVSWQDETPVVRKEKGKLFKFLRKLAAKSAN